MNNDVCHQRFNLGYQRADSRVEQYFHDITKHAMKIEEETKLRLRRRMINQGAPILPGSPRAWHLPVDEDSEGMLDPTTP